MQKIEPLPIHEIPDFIHEIMLEYIDKVKHEPNADIVTAQYFDMMFRAGWEMAKNQYRK